MPITAVDSEALAEVRLETDRLQLRWLEPADAEAVQTLVSDWDVARNLAQVPYPYPDGLAARWIAGIRSSGFLRGELVFAVTRRSDTVFLGVVALILANNSRGAEIGYWMGKPYWGQGYATEAVTRVIEFAGASIGIERLWGACLIENFASANVLEKSGLTFEGEGDLYFVSQGGNRRVQYFGRDLNESST
jgi:RimJ/RimL family protein N-acetyltransferase